MAQERGGHLGEHKTREKVARLFYWPALTKDVAAHCGSCATCQQYNRSNPRKVTLQEREESSVQFDVVCIDLIGPLPKGKVGVEYILTLIDQASRWPEATALKSSNVIKCLSDMFSRIGFPKNCVRQQDPIYHRRVCQVLHGPWNQLQQVSSVSSRIEQTG